MTSLQKDFSPTRFSHRGVILELCRVFGHVEKPIFVEEDGNCDEYYCTRCAAHL